MSRVCRFERVCVRFDCTTMVRAAATKLLLLVILTFIICLPEFFRISTGGSEQLQDEQVSFSFFLVPFKIHDQGRSAYFVCFCFNFLSVRFQTSEPCFVHSPPSGEKTKTQTWLHPSVIDSCLEMFLYCAGFKNRYL